MAPDELPTRTEVHKARKAELQAWCEAFDLDPEGTVPVLKERVLDHLEAAEAGEEYLVLEEEAEPEPEAERELPPRGEGQIYLYSLGGEPARVVDLPPVFRSPVRTDLIRRAVTAYRANRRQPYGASVQSGLRHAVEWWGKGRGVSRVPRLKDSRRAAQAPGTVGGRRAHPPRADQNRGKKMNRKERRKALQAALAAAADPSLVRKRGHRVHESASLPLVVEDAVESLESTRDAVKFLQALGLEEELDRAGTKKVRAGRGTMRGRKYRGRTGPLVVLSADAPAVRAFRNLPGVEVAEPRNLNAELLAPGGDAGRLTLFSEKALSEVNTW